MKELIITIVGGVAVVVIIWFWNKITFSIKWLWSKRPWKNKAAIPASKITLVLIPHRTLWNMGTRGDKPAMQIMTAWYATNVSTNPIYILNAGLLTPNPKGRTLRTITFMVSREDNFAHEGIDMPIYPHKTATVEVTFFLDPPTQKENEPLTVRMFVVDQYGHKHRSPKIRIKYRFPSAETF